MKKALNAWTVQPDLGMEDMFRQVSEAGFEGIELTLDAPGCPHALTMDTTEEEYGRIMEYSRRYTLPVISISSSLAQNKSGNPSLHESYRQLIRKQIEAARALGAKGILTAPAGMEGNITLKDAWKNTLDVFMSLKDEIDASGITVGLENTWKGFFTSPWDMIKLIDMIGSENVGAYMDVGNVIAFSSPEWWVEILGSRIRFIHIKDYLRNRGPNTGGHWADITEGSGEWPDIMKAIRGTGFDGYLTAEVTKFDPEISWKDYYRKVCSELEAIIAM